MTKPPLKIFLFGTGATGHAALSYFLKKNVTIAGICTNTVVPKRSFLFQAKVALVQTLYDLGLREPDDQILHDFSKIPQNVIDLARQENIPVFDVAEYKNPAFAEKLKTTAPDLILCFGFPKLLPRNVLEVAKISAVNIHPGFLPQRGGGTPVRWAIFEGDTEIGLTTHIMTGKFDAGQIIATRAIPLTDNDDSETSEIKIMEAFPDLMDEILTLSSDNRLERDRENETPPKILPPMRKNHNQINWEKHSADDIKKICRAMRPKGSAYTYIGKKRIYFWDVSTQTETPPNTTANGTIVAIEKDGIVIQTRNGSLKVHSVLFGYKIRSATFIVSRLKLKIGMIFVYMA